jgi:hypothetical protein
MRGQESHAAVPSFHLINQKSAGGRVLPQQVKAHTRQSELRAHELPRQWWKHRHIPEDTAGHELASGPITVTVVAHTFIHSDEYLTPPNRRARLRSKVLGEKVRDHPMG